MEKCGIATESKSNSKPIIRVNREQRMQESIVALSGASGGVLMFPAVYSTSASA